MLSKEASSTIFWVFGMTRPGIEPRSPGPLANTLTARPVKEYPKEEYGLRETAKEWLVWRRWIHKKNRNPMRRSEYGYPTLSLMKCSNDRNKRKSFRKICKKPQCQWSYLFLSFMWYGRCQMLTMVWFLYF